MSEDLPEEDQPLTGGWRTTVHRKGNVVHRQAGPWSESVVQLLRHLEAVGFDESPRPVGSGFDAEGNEVLSYIQGASPQPHPWSDEAISSLGAIVRRLHEASSSFEPSKQALWQAWHGRHFGDPSNGIGHGDLGPWNIMAVDGLPIGFIDWDTAGPFDPRWELAQVSWLNAQLHDDDIAERVGLGDASQRATQLKLLLDGYRMPRAERSELVERMVTVAVHDAHNEAVQHQVSPDTTTGVAADGYPFAWGIAWRVRSASWMLRHRSLLEKTILRPD